MAISSSRYVNINSVLVPSATSSASGGGGGDEPSEDGLLINGDQLLMSGETVTNSLGD